MICQLDYQLIGKMKKQIFFFFPQGVYVIGFSFPVVPKGKARIRVQISAAHTESDIDRTVDAFIQTGRKHGVIS